MEHFVFNTDYKTDFDQNTQNTQNTQTPKTNFRTNQLQQYREINEAVFDLVVKYKDTNHPLSNFLVLLNNENSWYRRRRFAGRMADLSDEEIAKLREQFFIYHDNSGHIRCEIEPEPGKSWGYVKENTTIPSFYIVQGEHPNRYNRHDIVSWDYPRDIDTKICSSKEDFEAMEVALYEHGFGNYKVWEREGKEPYKHYEFYDHSDEAFTATDKVEFIHIFQHIRDDNIPILFLHDECMDRDEPKIELSVENGFSFGRGVLGYTHKIGGEPNLKKVPKNLIDEHLKIVDRIRIVQRKGDTMTVPIWDKDGNDTGEKKVISMEKPGEYVFIEGIADKQKNALREKVEYYLNEGSKYKIKMYDDETLHELARFLNINTNTKPEQHHTEMDFLKSIASMLQANPPQSPKEYQAFVDDLEKKPDDRHRRHIEKQLKRKYYHDFESPVAGPKMLMIEDLQAAGYEDMVKRACEGDYDF